MNAPSQSVMVFAWVLLATGCGTDGAAGQEAGSDEPVRQGRIPDRHDRAAYIADMARELESIARDVDALFPSVRTADAATREMAIASIERMRGESARLYGRLESIATDPDSSWTVMAADFPSDLAAFRHEIKVLRSRL